jgi:hypothetical protein
VVLALACNLRRLVRTSLNLVTERSAPPSAVWQHILDTAIAWISRPNSQLNLDAKYGRNNNRLEAGLIQRF